MPMIILTIISFCSGVAISLNGIALILGDARNLGTYLTTILGLFLIAIAIFRKAIKKLLIYPIFKLIAVLIGIIFTTIIITSSMVYMYGRTDTVTYKEDYLIVLGCGLHGTEPSESLTKRLEKAVEYTKKNPDCTIIVTGGMGSGEDIPESEAMYIYLVDNGISPDRIIQENTSTSTYENFEFANKLTNNDLATKSAVFITSDFHIYRANHLAKLQGLSMNHMSAKTPWHSVVSAYLRENLALVKMFLFNK